MNKSFVNIVRESLIKPTPGTRFLFIKYQQGFSSTSSYLIENPSSKYNKPKKDFTFFRWTYAKHLQIVDTNKPCIKEQILLPPFCLLSLQRNDQHPSTTRPKEPDWLTKKFFPHKDRTRIASFSDLIKWTEFQSLSHVSPRNRHLWNTELLIYSRSFACLCSDRCQFPRFEATKSQNQTNKTKWSAWAAEDPSKLKNPRHQQRLYLLVAAL